MDEQTTFGLSMGGTVLGLLVMLVGVYLSSGQTLNAPTILGGAIVVAALALLTHGIISLDEGHAGE